jgi:small GTP-binding protein
MGLWFSLSSWVPTIPAPHYGHEIRTLLLGLDNAGKTSIVYKLKLDEVVETTPTIGFNVETIEYKGMKLCCWDVGGQSKLRQLWKHYYSDALVVVFVVDSADDGRMDEVKQIMHELFSEPELARCDVLIYLNKQDLPQALSVDEITTRLDIGNIKQPTHIQPCSVKTGTGLEDGLNWVASRLGRQHPSVSLFSLFRPYSFH